MRSRARIRELRIRRNSTSMERRDLDTFLLLAEEELHRAAVALQSVPHIPVPLMVAVRVVVVGSLSGCSRCAEDIARTSERLRVGVDRITPHTELPLIGCCHAAPNTVAGRRGCLKHSHVLVDERHIHSLGSNERCENSNDVLRCFPRTGRGNLNGTVRAGSKRESGERGEKEACHGELER